MESRRSSPPDLEHPAVLRKNTFMQAVAHRFHVDRFIEDGANRFRAALAKLLLDIHFVVRQETKVQLAIGCEPHAVATAAVRGRHRANKPDDAARTGNAVVS